LLAVLSDPAEHPLFGMSGRADRGY